MTGIRVPAYIPPSALDFARSITLHRCTLCGLVLNGTWGFTRAGNRPGRDHLVDEHPEQLAAPVVDVAAGALFVNCAIHDPLWLEESIAARVVTEGGEAA